MIKKFFLFCFCVTFLNGAFAAASTDSLNALLKNMHSLQGDFSQTILDNNDKVLQRSSGHVSIQRPGQFRWDVLRPMRQLIVTNGKKLWIYDPDLEQVTIRALSKAAGETPALLLSDEHLMLDHEFSVTILPDVGNVHWFLLKPRDKNAVISALKLGFLHQSIQQMQLQDHLGHKTLITFTRVKLNSSLPATLFYFKPPAQVDVIDETKR